MFVDAKTYGNIIVHLPVIDDFLENRPILEGTWTLWEKHWSIDDNYEVSQTDGTTWFDQQGLVFTENLEEFCVQGSTPHDCNFYVRIDNDESNYAADYYIMALYYSHYNSCSRNHSIYLFDKYTGTCLENWNSFDDREEDLWSRITFVYNGKKTTLFCTIGLSISGLSMPIDMPLDYDGLVIAIIPGEKVFPEAPTSTAELYTIDEVVDIHQPGCYFFAYNN